MNGYYYRERKKGVFIVLKKWQQTNNFGGNLSKIQGVILFVLLLGIAILVFVQVILRYVLHHPLMGIEELLLFPTIWLFMLGSAHSSLERTQIKAQVIEIFLKSHISIKTSRIIMGVISLVINCWLTYWAYQYFLYSIRVHKLSATLYIPLVYAESAVLLGFLLMCIYIFVETIDYIIKPLSEFELNSNNNR